jgi:hypothetical protein
VHIAGLGALWQAVIRGFACLDLMGILAPVAQLIISRDSVARLIESELPGWWWTMRSRFKVYVADRDNHRVQVFDENGKYETQWHNLMRPCGLFVARGKQPIAVIGELGPETVASLTKGVPNLGPRLSVVAAKGEMLAHLGTEPIGEGLGQFIAPHGIALDSRGDIYVGQYPLASPLWH